MIIKRKLYSKDDDRDYKDKKWDSVYGASVGTAGGYLASKAVYKAAEKLSEAKEANYRNWIKRSMINSKKAKRYFDLFEKQPHLNPDEMFEMDSLGKEGDQKVKEIEKKVAKFRLKRMKARKFIKNPKYKYAFPIAGGVIGALYGLDNNLTKQRRKAEDAVGDKVVDKIKKV